VAFQPIPLSRRFLRKQIALVLENPLKIVKKLWKKQDSLGTQSPTMETYTEAANRFIKFATAFIEHAGLLAEAQRHLAKARDAYRLRQKEIEIVGVRKEIDALKIAIPLLIEKMDGCQIEYASSDRTVGMPCGKPAVAECTDCGGPICSKCRVECCGDSFCEHCYTYHVEHSCLRKPIQNDCNPLPTAFRPTSDQAG
jgi:hypothetical protein